MPGDATVSRALARVAQERKLLRSALSDELIKAKTETWSAAKVLAALRRHGAAPADAAAKTAVADLFKDGTDERWLAEKLLALGPEPLWPAKDLDERALHAKGAEAGIEAKLPYPPEAGTKTPKPVRAFYFPGVTTRRALIIGGIHGNEPQGARVVEGLRKELDEMAAKGKKPHFTVILVPVLFERTHDPKLKKEGARNVGGVEPNRTYPRPGEDYKDVRARVAAGQPELMMTDPAAPGGMRVATDAASTTVMLPETRALVALVERYQPERIASCHAHKIDPTGLGRPGDDPGVFVDPRVARPGKTNAGQVAEDDALATEMLEEGSLRMPKGLHGAGNEPYLGNIGGSTPFPTPRVRYKASHPEGHSLGDWAPAPTATREGITTVTVEVPRYGDDVSAADKLAVEDAHRQVLLEIFLGDPAQAAAAQKAREVVRELAAKVKEAMREAAVWLGLGDPDKPATKQKPAANRAVARQIEMRDAGRGEASGLPRLPELVDRLTAISQSLTFHMDGSQLAYEQSPNVDSDEFDRQMIALIDGQELIPLRLTTRENRLEDQPGQFTEQISGDNWQQGYVDIDDLLAGDDLALKLQLVHFLTERAVTKNYAKRMGIDEIADPAHLTAAEFRRGHAQGNAAEVKVLQDFFGDPTIRLVRDVDAATFRVFRNSRGDEIREIEHQGTGAERGVQSDTVVVVTKDGARHTPDEYKAILETARAAPATP